MGKVFLFVCLFGYQNHASLTEETVTVFSSWEWERGAPPFYLQVGIRKFVYVHLKHNSVTLSMSLNTTTSYLPNFLSYAFFICKMGTPPVVGVLCRCHGIVCVKRWQASSNAVSILSHFRLLSCHKLFHRKSFFWICIRF